MIPLPQNMVLLDGNLPLSKNLILELQGLLPASDLEFNSQTQTRYNPKTQGEWDFSIDFHELSLKPFKSSSASIDTPDNQRILLPSLLEDILHDLQSLHLALQKSSSLGAEKLVIELMLRDQVLHNEEEYSLIISSQKVQIIAPAFSGIRFAIISLVALIDSVLGSGKDFLSCMQIEDFPHFPWRGLHLDVSRHFFAPDFIKTYLNLMHQLKLNKFHWHLSDDQGWRIESKAFPLLHQRGSIRSDIDGNSYGGFYRQEEIKDILHYAQNLGIEIIPELDIPGHAQAILAAYPDFACFPTDFYCMNTWGISENILCAGKDTVLHFLETLLCELHELFGGLYIHLGGDEVPKTMWKACPLCQKRIGSQALQDEEELQGWLLKHCQDFLLQLNKQVIVWDEVLDTNIDSSPIIMIWQGDGKTAVQKAQKNRNYYILCPNRYLYFDWKYASQSAGAHGISTLENVYGFPFQNLDSELLLGLQANVWTEYMPTPESVWQMLIPRIHALAELAWTDPQKLDYVSFKQRIELLGVTNAAL